MGTRGRSHHPAAHLVSRALLALTGLVALSLAACTASGSQGPGLAASQVFSWAYVNGTAVSNPQWDVAVLDPAVITNSIDSPDISMLYSGLVTLNSSTLQIEPDAAQSINVSPDGKEYTFVLRPNLFFSDGTPITAQTFAYSIDRAIGPTDPNTGESLLCNIDDPQSYGATGNCASPGAYYLGIIDGAQNKSQNLTPEQAAKTSLIGSCGPNDPNDSKYGLDVIDSRTLRICISHPASYFLDALDYPTSFPVEQSLIQKYPNGTWVEHLDQGGCSGPFRVKAGGYVKGKELDMIPNPYWEHAWNKNLTLTEVDRPFIASQDTEYHTYDKSSTYDFTDVPADEYTFAVGQSDFHQIASLFIDYFGVNFHQPPFDNLDVRQAFDLALNKQLLVDRVFNGEAIPTNHIVPQGMPGFDPQLNGPDGSQSVTGNQTLAGSLLNKAISTCSALPQPDYCPYIDAKQNSLPIKLSAGVGDDASQQELATIATQTWKQVLDLNVSIHAFPDLNGMEGQLFAPGGNTAQMWQIAWIADYPDPQDWLSLQFHTGALYDLSNVSSPAMDQLMDQADANVNSAQRMNQYHQVEQYMVNQVAWLPFDQEKTSWRLRPWVQGFGLNAGLDMEDVDWPNVSIEAH